MTRLQGFAATVALACVCASPSLAQTTNPAPVPAKWVRSIPLDLAVEAAKAALAACSGKGVSVGVVDHNGHQTVLLVEDYASMVGQKALPKMMHTAIIRQSQTQVIANNSKPGGLAPEVDWEAQILNRFNENVLVSPGAVPIFVGEGYNRELLGVIGVAGASPPGSGVGVVNDDQRCALAGLDKIKDRLK